MGNTDSEQHRLMSVEYTPAGSIGRLDLALAATLGIAAALLSLLLSARIDPKIYGPGGFNVWFQADPPRVLGAMTDPASHFHYRTSVHPLGSLLTTPAMRLLRAIGLAPVTAGRLIIASSGFATASLLTLSLLGLGLSRVAALMFTLVFLASATYVHWFALIEMYALAAASIGLMLMILTSMKRTPWWVWWLGSVATLSVTVTNWMLGLSATFFRLDWRRMLATTAAALVAVVALSVIQRRFYPQANYFFMPRLVLSEHQYMQVHRTSGVSNWAPWQNVRSEWITSAVAPRPELVPGDEVGGHADERIISNQRSPLASYTVAGWVAIAAWVVLLFAGVQGGYADVPRRPVFFAVCAFVIGQSALHLVYGPLTFLYAADFFPAMVLLSAFSWFSRFRVIGLGAALTFIVFGAAENFARFSDAVQLANVALR